MPAATIDDVMKICQALQHSFVLRAGIELKVFDVLDNGAATADAVSKAISADARASRVLLDALVASGFLILESGFYSLTDVSRAYLVQCRPGYLAGMAPLRMTSHFMDGMWRMHDAVIAGGSVIADNGDTPSDEWGKFARESVTFAASVGRQVADRIGPFITGRGHVRVLDVGCGSGLYGYMLAKQHPQVHVTSLDWMPALKVAREVARKLGVADRVHFVPGDAFEVPLDGPFDLMIASNFLHVHSVERCAEWLQRAADAIAPNGMIAINEILRGELPPSEDPMPYILSAMMLVWSHRGEAHTRQEYDQMLVQAGFHVRQSYSIPGSVSTLLIAGRN